jgi:hypothetical protein
VKAFLDEYFDLAVVALAVLFIGGFVAVNLLARRGGRQHETSRSLSAEGRSRRPQPPTA